MSKKLPKTGHIPVPSVHDVPERKATMSLLERFHKRPGLYLAITCGGIFTGFLGLYLYTEYHLWAHFAAVFLEVSLAILFIEELIKPSTDRAEAQRIKREKKRSFLRNVLRVNIDVMVLDSLAEFESITRTLQNHRTRMGFIQDNRKYFHYFDKLRPFHGSVIEDHKHVVTGDYKQFLESWELLLQEAIDNMKLICPKPQYTPYHSWDRLIELYSEIRRQTHEVAYLRQNVTPEQERLKLYFASVKLLTTLILDLSHFGVLGESRIATPENEAFARKVWHVWTARSSRE